MDAKSLALEVLAALRSKGCKITLAIHIGENQTDTSNEDAVTITHNNDQQTNALDKLKKTQAYDKMRRAGIKEHVAADLCSKYTPDRINQVCQYTQSEPHLRNRPGMIVSALTNNWYRNGKRSRPRKGKRHDHKTTDPG